MIYIYCTLCRSCHSWQSFPHRATADISDPYIQQLQLLTTAQLPIMKSQTTPTKHSQPITANQAAPVQQAPPRQHAKQKKKPPSPKQQKPRVRFLCEKLDFLFSEKLCRYPVHGLCVIHLKWWAWKKEVLSERNTSVLFTCIPWLAVNLLQWILSCWHVIVLYAQRPGALWYGDVCVSFSILLYFSHFYTAPQTTVWGGA